MRHPFSVKMQWHTGYRKGTWGVALKGLIFISGTYSFRVYCVIGDAESAEGSVWEALNFASYYKLGNLCAIFDINRLGQSDPTMLQHDFETYKKRTEAFG